MKKTVLVLSLVMTLVLLLTSSAAGAGAGVTNTGIDGIQPSASGSIIAFLTLERTLDQDLNGDGDITDYVVMYYDTAHGSVMNTGAVGFGVSASGSIIAFQTAEVFIGQDLNGDGDRLDYIIRYYDVDTGVVTNTGTVGGDVSASGSIIAFRTHESWIGQDLNGDGDTLDGVIRYYDIATGAVTNTGAIGDSPSASGSIIAFRTFESWAGQDLNGDGDAGDAIIRYYDLTTGTVINTRAFGDSPSAGGSVIAFHTFEGWISQDLNGDGDASDWVVRYYDIAAGTTINTGVLGNEPSASGSIIAFYSYEGWLGEDLNGDGDITDPAIRYYDTATGTIGNTGAPGYEASAGGSIIAFRTGENWNGQDLNGDGDILDYVIQYFTISQAATIESLGALIDGYLTDGSIDNKGVAHALQAMLEQSQASIDRGSIKAAVNTLNAFVNLVEDQAGKHISAPAAQNLIGAAGAVIAGLQ